jgi:hypothetical protein
MGRWKISELSVAAGRSFSLSHGLGWRERDPSTARLILFENQPASLRMTEPMRFWN